MVISSFGRQKIIKLDSYDKKIFWQLSLNSRIPKKQLAKKVGISQERLHYKINRLTKELIEPSIILNYNLLGIKSYIILIENLEKEQLEKLLSGAPTFFLIQNIGKHDYLLYALTEDIEKFCKDYLPDSYFKIFPVVRQIPDNYNGFNLKVKHPEPIKNDKKISLDKKDYKILYYLSKNPIGSIVKLSERSKIDRKTIISRIKRLIEANAIQKFRFAVNIFKAGFTGYFLKIKTTPKNKEAIIREARRNNYSGFIYETYNGFFMWYLPPDHNELFDFTKKLKKVDSSVKVKSMQTAEILKLETVPKKVLEIFKERFL